MYKKNPLKLKNAINKISYIYKKRMFSENIAI